MVIFKKLGNLKVLNKYLFIRKRNNWIWQRTVDWILIDLFLKENGGGQDI